MNVTEILQFVDTLVFTETEKHLDDLQKRIIEELFKGKTYKQIADIYEYDEGYIGDESRKLFKLLSDKLGEEVNKSNFCWTIERITNSIVNYGNHNINLCPSQQPSNQKNQQTNNIEKPKNKPQEYEHDLELAPRVKCFYGREAELEILNKWIFNDNVDEHISIINVLGLKGVGKSTLVKRFVDINLQKFDLIIWNNLKIYPCSVNEFLARIINQHSQNSEKSLTYRFLQLLKQRKCLIIFDDVQSLFTNGEFAGKYQHEYQDYQQFLQMMTEFPHQSNIILISQEQPSEFNCLNQELSNLNNNLNKSYQCLELSGLYNINVLNNLGLKVTTENHWLELIKLYHGNPIYLEEIASLIRNLYGGNISEFLKENITENSLVITKDINFYCSQLFNRLSTIEQKIVLEMSKFAQPISKQDLKQYLQQNLQEHLTLSDIVNGLESLRQRYIIKQLEDEEMMLSVDGIFQEYVINENKNIPIH
ncbi:ATP-binding protein [Anabaena sp. FACHB-1237]|uniref:NB-ARC domain-containing protein n=1 Tax=Anabaena sp. FACHB-1237 TaxID=2692769 RepID=UPI0016804981|nr:ATP-binding protein [Anabaena sp. FACHB-1237]MBD2136686.1 ATP-binding protein [Anabaena sp. FACHB-1237]